MIPLAHSTRIRIGIGAALLVAGAASGAGAVTLASDEPPASRASSGENKAFIDAAATESVVRDVSASATAVFTIRPDAVGATRRQARRLLVDDAVEQYDELYGDYLRSAEEQGLTLQTVVRAIGVTWLDDDRARLLVLADQAGATASGQTGTGPAQLVLGARRTDGRWKIASIELL